ncbi:protein EARLY RESPONSIVE TO DEHYDRATION 15-like isoform X1 [Corylus avellana]|uniref:protein EARLY RESPONSIVE TO DEHYDRATION 15-like isoform X1 n=1 Tax=Corylus avellana TaxID=13451 RepID=UPI00286AE183|nr:protein EARLY RESPONSIVE TO DEHYDRATION 15-like isoform X1 [Corylus avellana]
MALVCGERSTLNPNAPLFIPAAFRQVEDFSPEWWELVKTSTWFRDYWLSQYEDEDFEGNADDDFEADDYIANMLPEAFDLGIVEEFPTVEAQSEEMVPLSVGERKTGLDYIIDMLPEAFFDHIVEEFLTLEAHSEKMVPLPEGVKMDAKALLKNLSVSRIPNERGPKSPVRPAKYQQKPAKYVSPKCSPRQIHQPR